MQGFGGETWRKVTLGRRRRRWEDNFKTYLQEMGWEVLGINLAGSGYGSVL